MSRFMRRFNKEEGFTLIELLIVIAILGILVALAVPRMSGVTGTAKKAADEANRRTLMSAAAMWYAQNPGKGTDWTATGGTKAKFDDEGNPEQDWAPYLQEWPVNPLGADEYSVKIDEDGNITIDPPTASDS